MISPYAHAISRLTHAARVDPALRDAVRTVERHVARIENTVVVAIELLDAEHAPLAAAQAGRRGGCVMCWPQDGSWPCLSRMVADDLRALFQPQPHTQGEP